MDKEQLLEKLESHLKEVEGQASELYIIRLKRTIQKLKEGLYLNDDEELIIDLQSLGFQDLAQQIRKGQYI